MNAIAYMLHFRLFLLHMLPTHSHWPTFVDYCPGTLNVLSDSLLNIQENERKKNVFWSFSIKMAIVIFRPKRCYFSYLSSRQILGSRLN